MLYFFLHISYTQTWITNRVAWYFSNQWNTKVYVKGVDVEFWKKIVLEGVYIGDKHNDTLLYAQKLKLDIGALDRDSNNILIEDAILKNATVKLVRHKGDSVLNFQFLVDAFSSKDTTHQGKAKWNVKVKDITLDNIRFIYHIEDDTTHLKGINYSNIEANYVNGKIADLSFDADTTHFIVNDLSLVERSGFILKKLSASASVSPVLLQLNHLDIASNHSRIYTDLSFRYNRFSDFNHFIDSVKITSQFKSSNVEMADVAYFSPELYGLKKKVFLDGKVSGRISDLKGRDVKIVIGNETSYRGDFDISGLPDINQTFMIFHVKELRTSKNGIESIPLPPFNEQHFMSVPQNVSLFGIIKFKGNFSGFYNDFVSYGKFTTALGKISTDISLKIGEHSNESVYSGKFACKDFNLGKFFEADQYVGLITMNAQIIGKGFKKENAVLTIKGNASDFQVKGYNYKNIDMKGKLAKNIFDGFLSVNDDNLKLDFNGDIDFSKSPIHLDFLTHIEKAYLSKINLVKSDTLIGLTGKVAIHAIGDNLDNVIGGLNLNDLSYRKGSNVYNFQDCNLNIQEQSEDERVIDFNSSVADAHIAGKIKPAKIVSCFNNFLSQYLPSYIPPIENSNTPHKKKGKQKTADHIQQFDFRINFKDMDAFTKAFFPSLRISKPASLQGNYDEEKQDFSFEGIFPFIKMQSIQLKNCNMAASIVKNKLLVNANCRRLKFADSVWIDSTSLALKLGNDTAGFKLKWHNNTKEKYNGDIPGYIAFSKPSSSPGVALDKPRIKMKILPSVIVIADTSWSINPDNEVLIDSSFTKIKNMEFVSGVQRIKLYGNISELQEDRLYLTLNSFSLSGINSYLRGTSFSLFGTISGTTSIRNVYNKPLLESSIDVKNLKINNEQIGDGIVVSVFDSKNQVLNFNSKFKRDGGDNLKISGNYFPYKLDNNLQVDAAVNDFDLTLFNPFIKDNFDNLQGTASAKLKITGTPDAMLLKGIVDARVDNIHVNYLGTDYHFTGKINVDNSSFDFANITILDANNNKADIVNGKIFHHNFKNFQFDVDVSVNKFLCLNTTQKDNPVYYGRVFGTGIFNVFGFLDNINLSASIKTDKAKNLSGKNEYSKLFIPLSGSEEVGDNDFVTFVKKDTMSKPTKYKVNTSGFTMDFKLQPTSDAEIQLIFDEKVGDIIKGSGTGDIRMVINEFGTFNMFGNYTVTEGDYLFTLKNVVNKKFRLERGGTIYWSGDPENADINMSAIYELRTSLAPLFLSYEQTDAIRKRYPVDCVMNLQGKLMQPDISFVIRMPTLDDFTKQKAYEKFNYSESEINKQVFSLMFTNSFSPPQLQGQGETVSGGPDAGTVTSTEMLSNQLSNWLSQISKDFDVGVHYRPGDIVNKDQVELALSTQLFNDKMSIDGSVANNSNTTTQNPASVVGDINVDYKLTDDGKFRAKAYNKSNEGDVLNTQKGPYTQGVGVFYREEFETLGELYRRFLSMFHNKKEKK